MAKKPKKSVRVKPLADDLDDVVDVRIMAMQVLRSEDADVNALAVRALKRVGIERVSDAARQAYVFAHQAERERGEIVAPATRYKELLQGLLDEPR